MKIASFSYSLSNWPTNIEAWENNFLTELDDVLINGVDIIVYPELFLMGIVQYFPGTFESQLIELATYTEKNLKSKIAKIIANRNIFLCLGTGPKISNGLITNTSWIWNTGAWGYQDKLHLTPWETSFTPGNILSLFTFKNLLVSVLICFDVEQPSLCSKLKERGINLLIVPSATADRNGSQRVNRCASARSIELGAAVITAPLVGKSTCDLVDENEGRQGFYLPAQSTIKSEQEVYSAYSNDEKIISYYEFDENALLSLKNKNGETKPYLVSENLSVAVIKQS